MTRSEFLDCPAFIDGDHISRCGLPAHVEDRYALETTDGPLECVKIRCPEGHWFSGSLDSFDLPRLWHAHTARLVSAASPFYA